MKQRSKLKVFVLIFVFFFPVSLVVAVPNFEAQLNPLLSFLLDSPTSKLQIPLGPIFAIVCYLTDAVICDL